MKKWIAILLMGIIPFGVMSCKTSEQDMAIFAVETAAMVAGQFAATEGGVVVTPAMQEYFQMVMSGEFELTAEEYARISAYLSNELGLNGLIVNRIMALGEMVGVEISGEIIDVEGVDIELLKACFNGFMMGLSLPRHIPAE